MKITYKGIARAAGYRAGKWGNLLGYADKFHWWEGDKEDPTDTSLGVFNTEQEAYEDCCRVCGLVEDEE